ncbi:MAG: histidine phosphatase family protein [Chloroflexota bacterium]
MPTRIILVRHGQTEWNREERFRGRADIDLNQTGLKQAEAAAATLSELGAAALYSSPLKRALRTAEVVARRLGLVVVPLEGVTDVDYGYWQGLSLREAEERDPGVFAQWRDGPQLTRFPGGESMEEVRARAAAAVDALALKHAGQSVVVVSHVVVCRLLVLHLLGLDTSRFWHVGQDNCAVSIFEMRDGLSVALRLNDTCHLRELEP